MTWTQSSNEEYTVFDEAQDLLVLKELLGIQEDFVRIYSVVHPVVHLAIQSEMDVLWGDTEGFEARETERSSRISVLLTPDSK